MKRVDGSSQMKCKTWRDHLLRQVRPMSGKWDLHHGMSQEWGNVLVTTDGGADHERGYYGWVILAG